MSRESYAHGHGEDVLRSHRWRTVDNSAAYLAPHLGPHQWVLDVGCGPGSLTIDLARRVAPGRVVGIDREESVLEGARASASDAPNVEFVVGDAYDLDRLDARFDVVHAHQVLQHLADPVRALRAMASACRPGGIVAVREVDYLSSVGYPEVTGDWLDVYLTMARRCGGEPSAGRFLKRWAREAGLTDVVVSADVWCFSSDDDRAWWGGTWAERSVSSAYAVAAVSAGVSSEQRNEEIARRWRAWAADPDGWFAMTHASLLARVVSDSGESPA